MQADILAQLAAISPQKRELLQLLMAEKGISLAQAPIAPQPRDTNIFPLSFAQERLWFLDQLMPGSSMYNIPLAVRLNGRLHLPALEKAIHAIVRRHEILRTTFTTKDEQPVQLIAPDVHAPLHVVEAADWTETAVQQHIRRVAQQPFDLAAGPLFRLALLRRAPDDAILLLTMHHIISDGWSMSVIVRELGQLYTAFLAGDDASLPQLSIQYVDFARWQRDWLSGDALAKQLAYWKAQLDDAPPLLQLPTDRPRTAGDNRAGAAYRFTIPAQLADDLRALSRAADATLFMTLLAAFQILLYRLSGQSDVCVGSPVANRSRSEIEKLIGFFVNTLVLRARLTPAMTFSQLLQQARQTTLDAQAHQDLPFEMLVDALHPDRSLTQTPLFQVMFALQNAARRPVRLPHVTITPLETDKGTAAFDLTLLLEEQKHGLDGVFEYNADLFDEATMARMAGHLQTLLTAIAANPHQPIAALPLLTEVERRQLLVKWNDTAVDLPLDQPAHERFAAQAQRTPNQTALICDQGHITYAELNRRANQLAHYLIKQGVGPEAIVAVYTGRSLQMIVAVLGALKAGAAYLPIDPTYPAERIAFMLEDAQPQALITNEQLVAGGEWPVAGDNSQTTEGRTQSHNSQLIILERDWPLILQESDQNPAVDVLPDHLAYVIFTSGSTGRPKGALLHHRGLNNLSLAYIDQLGLDETARVLQFFSFGFDGSVGDIFSTLTSGATLCLPSRETLLSIPDLHRYLQETAVTHIHMTPSMLAALPTHDLPHLRLVLAGGEQFTTEIVARWLPNRTIVNAYGPTETTVVSVWHKIHAGDDLPPNAAAMPIGHPLPNTILYVLDANRQPVPVGVPGELHIGGSGVGRGYLHRPGLTAERFVPNPVISHQYSVISDRYSAISQHKSELNTDYWPLNTVYRTGDLVRYLPDGRLEFLGRIDHQVKVRGFRIELGEIEAALSRHEAVETAVAAVHEPQPNQKQLVAYIVPANGRTPDAQTLHTFLQDKLPGYMIPAAFITLDALPRLPNGKINRRALPAPTGARHELAARYLAPRTPTEELLAAIWADVLGVAQVGVHDNFFDLGGHSLLATRLISRIRRQFQVELPLRDLFETGAIAALVPRLDAARAGGRSAPPPITPAPRDGDLPLSFAQQRLWFLHQLDPLSPEYNVPDAVRLHGALNVTALHAALNEIIRRHDILRTTFPTVDGRPRQHIAPELIIPLPLTDLRRRPPAEREAAALRMAQEEAQRPFDLTAGPLMRAALIRLDDDEHLALLTLHHIVCDGWSTGVLVRELAAVYTAVCQNKPHTLPDLPIQYADFAHWQRSRLQGDVLHAQLDYWQRQLAGSPPPLTLPTDRPRPAEQTTGGAIRPFTLPADLTPALHALSREAGVTLFMTLLAAFQLLLGRYAGQNDVCVGTPIANRNHSDVENLIGFFVNTLVLRTDLSGHPSFRELLQRVRQTTLDAYAHQDLPFDRLVDALQPDRNLSHTPLFQVMFILQNTPVGPVDLPGLTLRREPLDSGIANFDLTLVLEEADGSLAGGIEYNIDLFDAATIDRLIGHYQTVLRAAVANPDQAVAALPLLPASERRQLLVEWNDTAVSIPSACIHHLFAAQAEKTPQATAVVCEPETITYRQLNQRANQLAHHLQKQGVGPESIVGIALPRSLDLLVALLAVLKAGAAYLPLDPTYPAERLAFMLEDAQPQALITNEQLVAGGEWRVIIHNSQFIIDEPPIVNVAGHDRFANCQSKIVNLDTDWPIIAAESSQNPAVNVTQDHLAYVIYTSGSTGAPKGVPITHRAVVNHNLAVIDEFGLQAGDRVWQFATINFDTAVEEIFPTLQAGATLVLRNADVPLTADLCRHVADRQLTVLDLPTAYWHDWVRELSRSPQPLPACLRLVVVGGEKASAEAYRRWRQLPGAAAVTWLNTYGPSETTVISTLYHPTGPVDGEMPIGRPLANTCVYVLDDQMQPVPIGVPGELVIGGLGVARGYHRRPALTAARFMPNPFASGKGAFSPLHPCPAAPLLYKTGDRVRWLPDGNLQFLGRVDEQVKIRGFRVEPGEVEAWLAQHPHVAETAVTPHTPDHGPTRLVAYVVPQNGAPAVTDLRAFLQEKLPDYMTPAHFITLDEMPRLPNGKINRRALPAPDHSRPDVAVAYAPPATPAEETVAAVWRAVLGLEQVGVHDNFFELGGDSILTIQVIARARQAGLHLTPRDFFAGPTVAELAAAAAVAPAVQAEQGVVTGPAPLTPIQRWFFDQDLPQPHHWNQALLLAVKQPLRRDRLQTAVLHLLTHHDALRLRFEHSADGWRQTNAGVDDAVPLDWIVLSGLDASAQETAVSTHCATLQAGLDLSAGPLLRVAYFDCGPGQNGRLFIAVHHLAVDGVSWRILLEDLQTVYGQLAQGAPPQLPPKTTSFRAWAQRLAAYAAGDDAANELAGWTAVASTPPLPRDVDDGDNREASAHTINRTLDRAATERLLRHVPAVYRSEINHALLTALAQTVQAWSGASGLRVEMESHGRADLFDDLDVSRTVGWFTAVYPLTLTLPRTADPGAALKAVKEQLRAVPRQGIGFGLLRYLHPDAAVRQKMAALPPAEISFNYLGQLDQALPPDSPFAPAAESRGPDRSPNGRRAALLDVTGTVVNGRLHVAWTYSQNVHRRTTVERLANAFIDHLHTLIDHCRAPQAGGLTPSDVPLAKLDQKKLDKVLAKVNRK